jgi:hypothetical protein
MPLIIGDFSTNTGAGVDSSNRQLTVTPNTHSTDGNSRPLNIGGGERGVVEVDAGFVTTTPLNRALQAYEFRRLEVSMQSIIFHEMFNGTAINTAQWTNATSTMTTVVSGAKAVLNGGSSIAINTYDVLKSYRTVPLFAGFPLIFECCIAYQAAVLGVPNTVVEFGMGYATTTTAPTDGAFFRWNAAGNLLCVVNFNGVETVSSPITSSILVANTSNQFKIVVGLNFVEFWVGNIMMAIIATPAGAGLPFATQDVPVTFRVYNAATAPTSAVQLGLYSCSVYLADQNSARSYEMVMAGLGGSAIQGQTGGTMGSTANHINSTAAIAATLSNTAAGYTKLGGRFLFSTVAGAATDYALFAFQVPAASTNVPGKTMYIRGVHISSMNIGAAVATTATVLQWAIGVGSTAASLATTESATTKAPRIIDLGMQSFPIGAAIAQTVPDLDVQFPYPLMCEAGNIVHIIVALPIGTATASQQIQGTVAVNAVFE